MKTTIYSLEDIQKIVCQVGLDRLMDDVISELTKACREFDPSINIVPARDGFESNTSDVGLIEWMPSLNLGAEATIKIVGYHPSNPQSFNLPSVLSTSVTFDAKTGHLLTLTDTTFLTAVRTGAASAVASKILASPNSQTLGLIGAGAQAITQLHALSRVFDLKEVYFYDIDITACNSFPDRIRHLNLDGTDIVQGSLEQVVGAADIICTATSVNSGDGPVFSDIQENKPKHFNAVGSDFPGKTELPIKLLNRSFVCPDYRLQAVNEGECQQLQQEQIGPDLVELVKEQHRYSVYHDKNTVFDSTGWAFEDHIALKVLTSYGQDLGIGTELSLACLSSDPKNPYAFLNDTEDVGLRVHHLR